MAELRIHSNRWASAALHVAACLLAHVPWPVGAEEQSSSARVVSVGSEYREFLAGNCVACHGPDKAEGGVRLDDIPLVLDTVAAAERWQKVLGVMNAGDMPPDDAPQPAPEAKTEFLADLSAVLAAARKAIGDQGRVATLRRLNRREYRTTVRDLLDVDVDVGSLPSDQGNGSFDTIGSGLFMSSDQFEQYLTVGRQAAEKAIASWRLATAALPPKQVQRTEPEIMGRKSLMGILNNFHMNGYRQAKRWEHAGSDPKRTKEFGFGDVEAVKFAIHSYNVEAPYMSQMLAYPKGDEGLWLMIGLLNVPESLAVTIPKDAPPGRYVLRLRIGANDKVPKLRWFLEMSGADVVGGEEKLRDTFHITKTVDQPQVLEVPVVVPTAGPRQFVFREKRVNDLGAQRNRLFKGKEENGLGPEPALWIDWYEWEGPLPHAEAPARAARVFGSAAPAGEDEAAARAVIEHVARRAFRGVTPEAAYLDGLVKIHLAERARGKSFTDALVEPLAVILASPAMLYLNDSSALATARPEGAAETDRALSDLELASRLSYFLWAAPPDDELLAAASSGSLRKPDELARQTQRMLVDPRSLALATAFTHQWLHVDRLDFFRFSWVKYYEFDEPTRDAAKQEIYRTFHTLMQDDLDARNLLKSDFVVVNGLLAAYYGIEDTTDPAKPKPITGEAFRKVGLPAASPRGGLLGMAAVHGMGSNGDRTSPVERGAWVLRKLLNDPPPPAPANVPQLSRLDAQVVSTRERLKIHQEQPQCAQCHRLIDPIGFGMENFDAAGRWRTEETVEAGNVKKTFPIEPAGAFHDGPAFKDFFELRDRVAARGDDFLRGLVENLYAYALGRPVSFADADAIDGLVAAAKAKGGKLGGIVHSIVASPEFQTK